MNKQEALTIVNNYIDMSDIEDNKTINVSSKLYNALGLDFHRGFNIVPWFNKNNK